MVTQVQARYIVERMDSALWAKVLEEDNPFRRQLIDQARHRSPSACPCTFIAVTLGCSGVWVCPSCLCSKHNALPSEQVAIR